MKNTMQRYGFTLYAPNVCTKNLPLLIFFHYSVTLLLTVIYN